MKRTILIYEFKRLESQKFIESYWGNESQGGRRKYYKITETGKENYKKSLSAWKIARDLIDKLIEREE
ncbi:helix-turn-helix transcriptional regulator [Clostridium sp. CF012]|uniref:PadR family transcriptional regulator n=1 Tax=Clostridium sp. CF012 TaxID=2843319 RepID=UPI001C0D1984|nr:PadR family transcriptional regulator [Clostridium sp. CF012]